MDAYTWTKGEERKTFTTRAQLYDWMMSVGDVILEGDDAPKFEAHVQKRLEAKHPDAKKTLDKLESMR